MPVDTSSYTPAQTANPLTTAANATALIGQMNQNKMFQQQFAARQALGPIYQQAIDPNTGELDTNKLLAGAAADPRAAFMAGDLAQQALARKAQQAEIASKSVEQAKTLNGMVNDQLSALLANPNVSTKDVRQSIADILGKATDLDPSLRGPLGATFARELAALPSDEQLAKDPTALRNYLQQKSLQAADAKTRLELLYPQQVMQDTGGGIMSLTPNRLTGTVQANPFIVQGQNGPQVLGSIPKTPTPGEMLPYQGMTRAQSADVSLRAADVMPVTMPNGQVAQVTRGSIAGMGGAGLPNAAGIPGALSVGPRPGAVPAAEVTGKASAEQGIDLSKTADQVPARKATLQNMVQSLQTIQTGPASDQVKYLSGLATQFGIAPDSLKVDLATREGFAKLANQLVIAQGQALGAPTDQKSSIILGATPNDKLSTTGNQEIIAKLLGNEDAIAAKNQAWQSWAAKNGADTYPQFTTEFNKSFDPRLYQMQYMSPDDRTKFFKSLGEQDQKELRQKANELKSMGLLNGRP